LFIFVLKVQQSTHTIFQQCAQNSSAILRIPLHPKMDQLPKTNQPERWIRRGRFGGQHSG